MVFTSHIFLFYFLPLVLGLYYLLPFRARTALIAVSSYVFYGWANPLWAVLMFVGSNIDYLCAAFAKPPVDLPVMLDTDGQRPEAIPALKKLVGLTQVTLEGQTLEGSTERGLRTLHAAAEAGMQHALVLCSSEQTSDAQLLRIVEQARGVSGATQIVIHPPPGVPVDRDRRWMTLLERAAALHNDVRFALKLPPPTGMR
jgi:hypothetical protein